MKIFEYLEKIYILNKLVSQVNTGSPNELAERLQISRTTLYEIINELKSRDVCISYSRSRRSFFFSTSTTFEIEFKINKSNDLPLEELEAINGGFNLYYYHLF